MTRLRHGMARSRIYNVWSSMIARCRNPNVAAFKNYGGRGISVCDEWLTFDKFLRDMGEPRQGMTLDRIDNDGPYSLANCRWAPRVDQARNTRRNRLLSHRGETLTLTEWAERYGLKPATVWARLAKDWTVTAALETPLVPQRLRCRRHGVEWSEPQEKAA